MSSNYDWRKHASMTAADDAQVEKAFMDQAYGFIANKAGPLMKDPHRLGFEVVSKNDTNTRMVGIFAFRVSEQLLYAPVFFINGEIKGTDLLYRHDTKTFVPLNDEWVTWLIEKNEQDTGAGIDKSQRKYMQPDVSFNSLVSPGGAKMASEVLDELQKAAGLNFDEWCNAAAEQTDPGPILKNFILQDGKQAAMKMLEGALSDVRFAEALVTACDVETFAPSELPDILAKEAAERVKQASASKLRLYFGGPPAGVKEAAETFYKQGFMLVDDRKPTEDKLSVVYEDNLRDIEQFSGPGLYDVLMRDGNTQKAFVARQSDEDWGDGGNNCARCVNPCFGSAADSVEAVVVLKDGNAAVRSKVMGKFLKTPEQCQEDGDLKETMASGKLYRVYFGRSGTLSRPVKVTGKRTRNGITVYTVLRQYTDSEGSLTHNPEFSGSSPSESILGDDARFIEVKGSVTKKDSGWCSWDLNSNVPTGDRSSLENWIWATGGLSKASLRKAASGEFFLKTATGTSNLVGRMDALVGLARDFKIHGDTAQSLIEAADRDGGIEFWLEPHEKAASAVMSLLGEPDFEEGYDDIHGVPVQNPQEYALDTEQEMDEPEDPRIGDAWDPTSADGLPGSILGQLPPEELQQLAQLHKLPNVFEHGVVGSLTKTFDSSAMIAKYLPSFEKALDSLGRVLFLFYWKPGDFEDAYGSDDMMNLENELLSNFKSFGQMTLNLLKKTKRQAEGSVPLPV